MSRPRRFRRVGFEPNITYFKPAGIPLRQIQESIITVDEFEAVRLKDFENLDQEQASKKMNISQPTFHRLVFSARKKIADALVNGKSIRIQGGNFKMVQSRGMGRGMGFGGPAMTCKCTSCGYEAQKQRGVPCVQMKCPKCGSPMVRG